MLLLANLNLTMGLNVSISPVIKFVFLRACDFLKGEIRTIAEEWSTSASQPLLEAVVTGWPNRQHAAASQYSELWTSHCLPLYSESGSSVDFGTNVYTTMIHVVVVHGFCVQKTFICPLVLIFVSWIRLICFYLLPLAFSYCSWV